jgi:hypothetical protein
MESSTSSAILQLEELSETIREVAGQIPMRRRIELEATTPTIVSVETTFGREVRNAKPF